jgi:hypothetical protein
MPDLGDAGTTDFAYFEIWDPPTLEYWITTPEIDLGMAPQDAYETCTHCLIVLEDSADGLFASAARIFYQSEGTIDLADYIRPFQGRLSITSTGVVLQEVTIDENGTTPVADGACLEVTDGTWGTEIIDGWTCAAALYDDGTNCHCGCGIIDPDCGGDATDAACDSCSNFLSCSDSAGADCTDDVIDPVNNAVCDVDGNGWTCNIALYAAGDDQCDCGCGVWDPDCEDYESARCDTCDETGSCSEGNACNTNLIHGVANWECTANPGWTCGDGLFDDGAFCDCGCGIDDPDCADENATSCDFCNNPGSCDQTGAGCPGEIQAADNTACN